jgi:type IV pilus assembly protein PilB
VAQKIQRKIESAAEMNKIMQELSNTGEFAIRDMVNFMLEQSVYRKASDIHIEPYYKQFRIRMRVDGIFQDVALLPRSMHEQFIARTKVIADLIPHKRDITQEGRISHEVDDRRMDFRLSVIPTVSGEKGVIRIFDPINSLFSLDQLGFTQNVQKKFEELILSASGMIILTGPSSAGKTTTLYAALQKIHDLQGNYASIVTIEDPVEYEIGLFSQIQVNRKNNVDFAACLSAILRQDPEVIMVGEIRDSETCHIAMRASLTGHKVLTTIHAGHSCEVVTRLTDMGIEPYIVSSSVSGVLAQRLVRKLCPHCKEPAELNPQIKVLLENYIDIDNLNPQRGRGCSQCFNTGYYGRLALTELLNIAEDLRQAILMKADSSYLVEIAREKGLILLLEDGIQKIKQGLTSVDEVLRVLGTAFQFSLTKRISKT